MPNSTPQERLTALPPITIASYPFDKANADIILRTSDRVDFHVYSQILVAASPFFEGMFDVPQPPLDQQQLKYGRPIIDVSETSKALDTLLRICYPINKPEERSLEKIELALAAAIKFEMELPRTVLIKELKTKTIGSQHPLEVWGIACRLGLESVARYVAKWVPLSPDFRVLGDMEGITAADYFRLREYLRLRRQVPSDFNFLSPAAMLNPRPSRSTAITNQALADAPSPDIICRSADGVEFRAHKTAISLASPTLQEKLSSASSPPSEEGSGTEVILPVLQFEEESVVLHVMLQLSYRIPADVTLPTDLADLTAVLVTMEKYGLHSAEPAVRSFWHAIASTRPLEAYCYAIRAGDTSSAKEAARCVLKQPLVSVYIEELEYIPALAYHRLLMYYEKCCTMAKEEFAKMNNSLRAPPPNPPLPQPGRAPQGTMPFPPPGTADPSASNGVLRRMFPQADGPARGSSWLRLYVNRLSSRFQVQPGSDAPELSQLFVDATTAWSQDAGACVWCERCQVVAEDILKVNETLRQLSDGLSEVELEI